MRKIATIILFLFAFNSFAQQNDTIVRKNGTLFSCTIAQVADTVIYYSGSEDYSKDKIDKLPKIKLRKVQLYKNAGVWYNNKKEVVANPVREINIGDEMKFMRENLRKCHNIYSVGIGLQLFGMGGIAYGAVSGESIGYLAGSGLALVGTLLSVYSHSFLGNAAVGIGGAGLKFRYVL